MWTASGVDTVVAVSLNPRPKQNAEFSFNNLKRNRKDFLSPNWPTCVKKTKMCGLVGIHPALFSFPRCLKISY